MLKMMMMTRMMMIMMMVLVMVMVRMTMKMAILFKKVDALIPDICHYFTLTHFESWKFYTWKVRKFIVRFPNCIVYSWVYNTQKTVKFNFDCFHSLH